MEIGKIPRETQKAAKDFADKLHQQRLQAAASKIEKEVKEMEDQNRTRANGTRNIQLD